METIRVYEDYATSTEKKSAQRGAQRGKPTGVARGYLFVFVGNGRTYQGVWEGMGPVYLLEPGSDEVHTMASTGISSQYLRENCRRVGRKHLPKVWADFLAEVID